MATVTKAYNMRDVEPRNPWVRYRVHVYETVEDARTGQVVRETGDINDFGTLRDALYEVADFIQEHGGRVCWDDLDGRLQSCWMVYDDPFEDLEPDRFLVSYTVWVEKVVTWELWRKLEGCWQYYGRDVRERELRLTLRRLEPFGLETEVS